MMDAVKFTRAAMRMCNAYYSKCWSCPAGDDTSCKLDSSYGAISAEEKVAIVEKWAKEHPVKTRQSEFLKLFPYARVKKANGLPIVSPCDLDVKLAGKCEGIPCQECWKKFWLAEVEE